LRAHSGDGMLFCAGRRVRDDEGGRHVEAVVGRGAVSAAVAIAGEDGHGHAVDSSAGAVVRGRDRVGRGAVHGALEGGETGVARQLGHRRRPHAVPALERGSL
jgi:hypothetical protein